METGDYELWAPNRVPPPSSPTPPPPQHVGSPPHLVAGAGMGFPPGVLPGGGMAFPPGVSPGSGVSLPPGGVPTPQLSSSAPPAHPNTIFSPVYAPRQKAKGRTRPAQDQASDDDEETFFDSETLPTPFGAVRPSQLTSPSSSCCPSDRESLAGDYSDREEEGWGGGRTPTFHSPHSPYYCPPSDGDVTPTRGPSPLPQPPLRKPREATGMRAHKGSGDEDRADKEPQVQAEKLLREDTFQETGEEQRGQTEKDESCCESKEINSKEDNQKHEEMRRNEELEKKEELSMREELQKKEKKVEEEEKERMIREERERDKRILKEIEERERERQVREKQRIADEKEKERLKEEREKERLKEERLNEEREEERKAIVARAKKE